MKMTMRRALYLAAALSLVGLVGGAYYAVAVQPEPSVKRLPMSWQKEARPFPNTGVDAQGRTLDQYVNAGNKAQDYRPIEMTTVEAGRGVYVLVYLEFRNKMAEPMIHRQIAFGKVTATPNGPYVDPNGMAPYNLGAIPAPTRTDGAAVKNHYVALPERLMQDAEGKPLTQPRTGVYTSFAKFIKNPVQSVELPLVSIALTVMPPKPKP
jgi:hypothetical protein